MPADPELDAVIVAAPDARRVPTPIEALETGRHVLCEKPGGVSRGAAAKLGLPVPVVGNALDEVRALAFARDPARAIPDAPRRGRRLEGPRRERSLRRRAPRDRRLPRPASLP